VRETGFEPVQTIIDVSETLAFTIYRMAALLTDLITNESISLPKGEKQISPFLPHRDAPS